MKIALLTVVVSVTFSLGVEAAPAPGAGQARARAQSRPAVSKVAEAYEQFMLGRRLEQRDDVAGAIAAYKRAMDLDPLAADVPAELAALYLRQDREPEAIVAAEQAVKVAPANREANRVLGMIYAAKEDASPTEAPRPSSQVSDTLKKAIQYLEAALDGVVGNGDPNVRATLARLYLRSAAYQKAIPLLTELTNQEQGWQDGPLLLLQAFAGAGRSRDAMAWLEQRAPEDPRLLPTLADLYERDRRWKDAAEIWGQVVARAPRNTFKNRYVTALLNAGGSAAAAKARDVLKDLLVGQEDDVRLLYLLSQAERRAGSPEAAEATARRVIGASASSPWGYYALAEALEERRQYKAVVDSLTPAVASLRQQNADASDIAILLPHLGFAHQELGDYDKAIAEFDEARRLAPEDSTIMSYLVEANLAAKKYAAAIDLARQWLKDNPDSVQFTRLEAQAMRQSGKADRGAQLLEDLLKRSADEPTAHVALAQYYSETSRGADAVKLLQDASVKFPNDDTVLFELGSVFDKQKRFADAEATFRRLLDHQPDNAAVLNYLGYMLAERGERLDESVGLLTRALEKEPYNGSFLDSLGWAYFKSDKLDLAERNLRQAADQLKANSVVQNHYGDVLFKLGRIDDAIGAWTRALAGDGDSIDRSEIDKKIRAARQKPGKK